MFSSFFTSCSASVNPSHPERVANTAKIMTATILDAIKQAKFGESAIADIIPAVNSNAITMFFSIEFLLLWLMYYAQNFL